MNSSLQNYEVEFSENILIFEFDYAKEQENECGPVAQVNNVGAFDIDISEVMVSDQINKLISHGVHWIVHCFRTKIPCQMRFWSEKLC